MLPVYERINELCNNRGINITIMCKEIPISRSILSEYKAGRTKTIKADVLSKISEYLETTTDYILGKTDDPAPRQKEKAPTETAEAFIYSFRKAFGREPDDSDIQRAIQHLKIDAEFNNKQID